jgi:AcrR family transcriptional regulator
MRAGVGEGEFAEVFGSVEDCVLAAFEQSLARLSEMVDGAAAREASWLGRLRAGLVAFLGLLDDDRGCARLLIDTPIGDGMLVLRCEQRVLGVLSCLLDQGGTPVREREFVADPALMSELVVGGVVSVVRARMRKGGEGALVELAPMLMSFIVRPYLGEAVARAELTGTPARVEDGPDPVLRLPVRATHRTLLVLRAIAQAPGSSNRQIAEIAGLVDEGQTSKLLARLQGRGVIENLGRGPQQGEPNAWLLTSCGERALRLLESGRAHTLRARTVRGAR